MDLPSRSSVIIVGAGASGISAAKVLAENGVEDMVILEASDRIGGRMRKEDFGGVSVELGAGWIVGVGGKESNPIWELANKSGLRTCLTDYSHTFYNIYDRSGKIFPSGLAADAHKRAVDSSIEKLRSQEVSDLSKSTELPMTPRTPMELAIDFVLHDIEMSEVQLVPTFLDFGMKEFLVTDERGFECLLYKMAEEFLLTSEGKILDSRLKLNKVVRKIQHSINGVMVTTEDGCIYEADYLILSVSIGVLQSGLISFIPSLPRWKMEAVEKVDVMVYTKIFLKFPCKFWPCEPGKEFFIYAHERRGYYAFWQHLENAFPGSNILVVTVTKGESKRIEDQADEETLKEAMSVLRDMFGPDIPDATDILVARWLNNRFQRGSYTNYPIIPDHQLIQSIKAPVGPIFFTGEHTSQRFSGYVHGGYLTGIETGEALVEEMRKEMDRKLGDTQTQEETVSGSIHKCDIPTQQLHLREKLGIQEAIL